MKTKSRTIIDRDNQGFTTVTAFDCNRCDKTFKKPHNVWFICIECHKKDRDTIAKKLKAELQNALSLASEAERIKREISSLDWQLENVGYNERLSDKLELE